jgi:hypothetical protein
MNFTLKELFTHDHETRRTKHFERSGFAVGRTVRGDGANRQAIRHR